MTLLAVAFFVLAILGAVKGNMAVALLSFFMLCFMRYAKNVFDEQDRRALADPARATKEPDTLDILDREGCECCVPEIPNRFSKSDSES